MASTTVVSVLVDYRTPVEAEHVVDPQRKLGQLGWSRRRPRGPRCGRGRRPRTSSTFPGVIRDSISGPGSPLAGFFQVGQEPPGQRRRKRRFPTGSSSSIRRACDSGRPEPYRAARPRPHIAAPQPLLGEDDGRNPATSVPRPGQAHRPSGRQDWPVSATEPGDELEIAAPELPRVARSSPCSSAAHEPDTDRGAEPAPWYRTTPAAHAVPDHRPAQGGRRNPPAGIGEQLVVSHRRLCRSTVTVTTARKLTPSSPHRATGHTVLPRYLRAG